MKRKNRSVRARLLPCLLALCLLTGGCSLQQSIDSGQILSADESYEKATEAEFEVEDAQGLLRCERYETGNDTLTLFFARPLESGAVLHGVWRANPGPCTPCDCMRMPMLSFYNLPIEE